MGGHTGVRQTWPPSPAPTAGHSPRLWLFFAGQVYQLLVVALDDLLDQGHPLVQPVDDRHLDDQLSQESGDHDNEASPGKSTSTVEVVAEDVVVEPCSLKTNHKHKSCQDET